MSKYRIIIADDIEDNLIRIEKVLNNIANVEIVGKAKNGEEELEKISELHPDLVITDNQMPILNGIDVIEKIRNSYKEKNIDFIIITADRNLTQRALSLNVFSIINQPYEDSKIIDTINEYIESLEYKKENIKEDNSQNFFTKIFKRKK